jgi:hypothetical protein
MMGTCIVGGGWKLEIGTWKLEACPERNRRIGRWRVEIEVGLVPSYDVLGVTSNSSLER